MQLLNITNFPIYLPNDKANVPFGDVVEGVTCTSAAPGVVTVPDEYAPANGDLVSLTYTGAGSVPTGLTYGTPYYVVSASGATFSLSATKGGSAITTSSTGSNLVLHLLSGEVDGVTLPFKPNNTVLVENNTAGTLVLQGANDANAGVGPPQGPGSWNTIVSATANSRNLVQLSYDWIRVSTAATLSLVQN